MSARGAASPVESLSARLAVEGLTAHAWGNGRGDRYGVHAHGYDRVLMAAAGSIVFSLARGTLCGGPRHHPGRARSVADVPAETAHMRTA